MNIALAFAVRRLALCLVAVVALGGCDTSSHLSDSEHLARARELRAKNDDKGAAVEIRNALQKNPKNADARILMAEIYLRAGGGKEAQTELEIALQRGANAARVKLPMARAYMLQGAYDAAANESEVTLASPAGDRAGLLEVQARARVQMKQVDRGCALYNESRAVDPGYIEAYWGAATCAAVKGNSELARSIVNDAIKIKPGESQSWVLLGDINRVDHQLDKALEDYGKALALKKTSVDALLGRGLAYVEARKLKEAEDDVAAVDKIGKGNALASYILGIIRFRQGRYVEAKNAFETTLTTAPAHFPSILWLGLTNFQQHNYEAAATQLNHFVTLQPGAVQVRAILAQARARLGGVKQAAQDLSALGKLDIDDPQTLAMIGETHSYLGNATTGSVYLARAVELQPDVVATRVNLATSLLDKNDVPGAIEQLKVALDQKPDYLPAASLMVRALIQRKDYAAAMESARALEKQFPQSPIGPDYVGSIQLLQGDDVAAKATFDHLLDSNPSFFPAANNLALLSLRQGRPEAARDYYQRALKADPQSLAGLLGLHNVERAMGHAPEAEKALVEAVRTHPTEVLPAQLLAQDYLSARLPRKALAVTEEASRAHPDDPGLLEVRGLAYLAVKEPASAVVPLNKLVQVRGDSAEAYLYLATANATLGDKVARKAALATALKIDPGNPRVQLATGVAALEDGKFEIALAVARALKKNDPAEPGGPALEGSALAGSGKVKEALKVLTAAAQQFPKSTEVQLALAKTQSAAGDLPAMVAGLRDWSRADPRNAVVNEALGEAYLRTGDSAQALVAYQAQLALEPDNVRALNNAAFLLRTQDPVKALEMASRATQLDPNNGSAFDTIGQIRSGSGEFGPAITAFQRARDLSPKDPRVRYHLAAALAKSGQAPLARRELERLFAATPTFEGDGDARSLLASLPRS